MSPDDDTERFFQDLETLIESKSDDLRALAAAAGIDPAKDFRGTNLAGFNLAGQDLASFDFSHANLTKANLTRANLTRANLTRANLTRANLTRANLTKANLSKANLTRANLTRANLTKANLSKANLTRTNLVGAVFDGTNLMDAVFARADLTDAQFTNVDCRGADFSGAKMPPGAVIDRDPSGGGKKRVPLVYLWIVRHQVAAVALLVLSIFGPAVAVFIWPRDEALPPSIAALEQRAQQEAAARQAAEQRAQQEAAALRAVADTTDKICGIVVTQGEARSSRVSGNVQTELSGLAQYLASIGVSGAGEITSSSYQNVLQQDLATALRDVRDCKLKVFSQLAETILPKEAALTAPLSQPAPSSSSRVMNIVKCKIGSDEATTDASGNNMLTTKTYGSATVYSQGREWGTITRQDDPNCPAILYTSRARPSRFCISARGMVSVLGSGIWVGNCEVCDTAGNCYALQIP